MNILKESKDKLPIDFITQFVSKGWEEVGNLKASCEAIKKEFKDTKAVEDILQGLIDSYLIALGQMELHLDKKDYVELPKEEKLKESLLESNEEEAQPIEAKKFEDNNKTEIFTELPDYDVEVEQKGDKIEIELEPKEKVGKYIGSGEMVGGDFGDDEWPEPVGDSSDIENAKQALFNGELKVGNEVHYSPAAETEDNYSEQGFEQGNVEQSKKEIPDVEFDYFMDFPEPTKDEQERKSLRG